MAAGQGGASPKPCLTAFPPALVCVHLNAVCVAVQRPLVVFMVLSVSVEIDCCVVTGALEGTWLTAASVAPRTPKSIHMWAGVHSR